MREKSIVRKNCDVHILFFKLCMRIALTPFNFVYYICFPSLQYTFFFILLYGCFFMICNINKYPIHTISLALLLFLFHIHIFFSRIIDLSRKRSTFMNFPFLIVLSLLCAVFLLGKHNY